MLLPGRYDLMAGEGHEIANPAIAASPADLMFI
jgi:hypothetical protein